MTSHSDSVFLAPALTTTACLSEVFQVLDQENGNTQIRFRLLGGIRQTDFLQVLEVSGKRVVFRNPLTGDRMILSNLKMIAQFELSGAVGSFLPFQPYDIGA